jgi:acetyl esterase
MTIDPELLGAVERSRAAWPVPGHRLPLDVWRARYESLVIAARPAPPTGVSWVDRVVGPLDVRVRIYQPAAAGLLPALVYLHGGGWVIGSIESHHDITAAICADAGCVIVSVDYARAPEHPFPRAFDEARAVLDWLARDAAALNVDPSRLLVGGDSAGGNLAAALALAAGEERAPHIAGQVLLYPCVDTDFQNPSYVQSTDAPFLGSGEMVWFWDRYAPDPATRRDRFAVPMRASDAQLAAVAPAYIATAQHDPLHDEGRAYAERLRRLGVAVEYEPGVGMVHGFVRLRGAAAEPARIYRAMCEWIRRCPAA